MSGDSAKLKEKTPGRRNTEIITCSNFRSRVPEVIGNAASRWRYALLTVNMAIEVTIKKVTRALKIYLIQKSADEKS